MITIIILLILAGITISQLTGSGLFENSRLAQEKWENAQEKEETELAKYENEINSYISGNRDYTPISYSTDEQDTGIKWIDGKKIYQKTITGLNISMSWSNQNYTSSNEFTALVPNVDRILSVPVAKMQTPSGEYLAAFVYLRIKSNGKWLLLGIEDHPITELTIQYTKTSNTTE